MKYQDSSGYLPLSVSDQEFTGRLSSEMFMIKKIKAFSVSILKRFLPKNRIDAPFYKRFPYMGSVDVSSVDRRGAYGSERNFFYNRVPKVANSSIITALATASSVGRLTAVESKSFFINPSEMNSWQVEKLIGGGFKFVFVRNPYTRILSAYLDKIVRRKYFSIEGKLAKSTLHSKTRTPTFGEFCTYLECEGLYANAHWAPQKDLLLLPVDLFDYIGRFENLASDISAVMSRIYSYGNFDLTQKGPPQTNAGALLEKYYTCAQLDRVAMLYASDFELFGYKNSEIGFQSQENKELVC